MAFENRCTAFVLDAQKHIAMTAKHCSPLVGDKVCFGAKDLNWANDPTANCLTFGWLAEVLGESPQAQLDYVIFRFDTAQPSPQMGSVKLIANDVLSTLALNGTPIAMAGYPADSYREKMFTESRCRVRSGLADDPYRADYLGLIQFWESGSTQLPGATVPGTKSKAQPLAAERDYPAMRNACYTIGIGPLDRPLFFEDCSVFGGNSGGPIVLAGKRLVIGMPRTYYPEKPFQSQCYKDYWDKFFKPYYRTPMPEPHTFDNWDKLDRNAIRLNDFPTAIPMHVIVENSGYLKTHPEYTEELKVDTLDVLP
jgi:hypothetical protein